MELILDGNRGIYLPNQFSKIPEFAALLTLEQVECLHNPHTEMYWDAWDEILGSFKTAKGDTLYQDGDLWLISEGEEIPEN